MSVEPSPAVNPDPWEDAYLRFETPAEEIRKFEARLLDLGARSWSRDAEIVDLFCGRANGLRALANLGFRRLEGVDLSPRLVAEYVGPAKLHLADCRALPFADASKDLALVQGGLHHLPELPGDLERTLDEVDRVLRPGGRFAIVEPWLTPFLRVVHAVADQPAARRFWRKLDALQTMIDHERRTYEQWLAQPASILALLERRFVVERRVVGWGKLQFVGRKR
ncbi:MAG TPA: class I SAM-dependent methyltransferase [Byssovorax sp.]|jgi:SAM-dependent methyltransferase